MWLNPHPCTTVSISGTLPGRALVGRTRAMEGRQPLGPPGGTAIQSGCPSGPQSRARGWAAHTKRAAPSVRSLELWAFFGKFLSKNSPKQHFRLIWGGAKFFGHPDRATALGGGVSPHPGGECLNPPLALPLNPASPGGCSGVSRHRSFTFLQMQMLDSWCFSLTISKFLSKFRVSSLPAFA